jgi:hypothetical protein
VASWVVRVSCGEISLSRSGGLLHHLIIRNRIELFSD